MLRRTPARVLAATCLITASLAVAGCQRFISAEEIEKARTEAKERTVDRTELGRKYAARPHRYLQKPIDPGVFEISGGDRAVGTLVYGGAGPGTWVLMNQLPAEIRDNPATVAIIANPGELSAYFARVEVKSPKNGLRVSRIDELIGGYVAVDGMLRPSGKPGVEAPVIVATDLHVVNATREPIPGLERVE